MLSVLQCVCVQSQPGSISLCLFHSAEVKLISTVWEDRQTDTQTPPSPPSTLTSLSSFISQQSIPLHSTLRGRGSRSTLPSFSSPYFIQVGGSLMEPECWIFHVDLPHHTFLSWGCWTYFNKHVKLSICISCLSVFHACTCQQCIN